MTPLEVVIVGGSLGGLMHGIVAARQGHKVTILERSADTLKAELGAGLGIADALAKFLHQYDCNQQHYSLQPSEAIYVDSQGRRLNTTRPGISATSWSTLYARLRGTFEGLKPQTVRRNPEEDAFRPELARYVNGAEVVDVRESSGVMQVEYIDTIHQKLASRSADHATTHHKPVKLSADLVIAADGAGSKTRAIFAPHVSCRYVGYAAWRGTILEKDMMEETKLQCHGNDRHCKIDRSFFLSYTIPGENGSLEPDKRLRNWVWYRNYAEDSAELKDILLDRSGYRHQYALPPDTIREEVWRRQQRLAEGLLDLSSADLVMKTKRPFFQAITEVVPGRAVYGDRKVLLVGDALAVSRPLSGQGTSQAAHSALLFAEVLGGQIGIEDWEENVLRHTREANEVGIEREQVLELGEMTKTV